MGVAEGEVRLEEGVAVVINGEPRSSHSSEETKRRSLSFDMKDVVSVCSNNYNYGTYSLGIFVARAESTVLCFRMVLVSFSYSSLCILSLQ